MASLDDQELSTAIRNADSPAWSVRAAAGRQLAVSDRLEEATDVIHRLLLDVQDTGVTQETAVALLEREDTIGLRRVLLARSCASETWTAEEIQAALDCDPDWMTTEGADRLIKQYRELATDQDVGVRDEAQRLLARLRPREEWARDSETDA
ncbi:hypothetical protein [Kitasatospora purpeofusca]|uniref:hypothetical protein n=1 Tax=Kitasatospora purpeofusca TaxID=67352 RepID=UPI002A5A680D|nr:hypothetical protein [Kitasatospora purpeofusca]MDY0812670.1 hypothetical protein [Kitasatospora purpeofusca]